MSHALRELSHLRAGAASLFGLFFGAIVTGPIADRRGASSYLRLEHGGRGGGPVGTLIYNAFLLVGAFVGDAKR